MKETSYESVVKKKKQAIESVGKEQVKQSKLKRENKRKTEFRKNKGSLSIFTFSFHKYYLL